MKYISIICILVVMLSCKKEQAEPTTEIQTVEENTAKESTNIVVEDTQKVEEEIVENTGNTAAPQYMDLDLAGYETPNINLKELQGEVVFLNHWGSWCGPCRREMPSIQALYDKYGEKVKFVMIATERRQNGHVPYLQKEGFTFPVYTMNSPVYPEIKAKGFPTTVILDKKGEIRTYDVGAADWNAPQVHDFLDKLLAE